MSAIDIMMDAVDPGFTESQRYVDWLLHLGKLCDSLVLVAITHPPGSPIGFCITREFVLKHFPSELTVKAKDDVVRVAEEYGLKVYHDIAVQNYIVCSGPFNNKDWIAA